MAQSNLFKGKFAAKPSQQVFNSLLCNAEETQRVVPGVAS